MKWSQNLTYSFLPSKYTSEAICMSFNVIATKTDNKLWQEQRKILWRKNKNNIN